MKKRTKINIKIGLILLIVAALLLVVVPIQAIALEPDQDRDGFTDQEEEFGITIPDGLFLQNGLDFLPLYDPDNPLSERDLCVDPETPDLFVILVPALPEAESNLDGSFNPFEFVGDLGITVHVLQCNNPDPLTCSRNITEHQKAIMAQEVLGGSSTLGRCEEEWCTPNAGLDNIRVWTQAIKNFIASKCGNKTCVDKSTGFTGPELENLYIQQTFAHEIGHDMKLRSINVPETGGFHYSAKEGVTMSQYMTYREGRNSITWNIATEYARNDDNDVRMWEDTEF